MERWNDADDAELVVALADGHLGALEVLYSRHQPWLSVRLTRRCNDREVVADVLQDTFVAAWQSAGRFRGEGDVGAWLWGIAIRRLVSRLRRRRAVVLVVEIPEGRALAQASAEESVLEGIEYGDLAPALERLSPELRSVLQATVLDGLSAHEAGHLLGVSEITVRTRLHRARARLRSLLAQGMPS